MYYKLFLITFFNSLPAKDYRYQILTYYIGLFEMTDFG